MSLTVPETNAARPSGTGCAFDRSARTNPRDYGPTDRVSDDACKGGGGYNYRRYGIASRPAHTVQPHVREETEAPKMSDAA
jgi:hypothetical protein